MTNKTPTAAATELAAENTNNNNKRLPDLVNQENEFWAQPEEEAFYIQQPPSTLLPPLPFTLTSDGLHDLPQDVTWLFGDTDADSEVDSMGLVELDIATDDINWYADLASPERTSDLSDDGAYEPIGSDGAMSEVSEVAMAAIEGYLLDIRSTVVNNTPDGEEPDFDPVVQGALNAMRNYDFIRATTLGVMNGEIDDEGLVNIAAGLQEWSRDTARDPSHSAVGSSRWERLPSFSSRASSVISMATATIPGGDVQPLDDDMIEHREEDSAGPENGWPPISGSPLHTTTGNRSGIDMPVHVPMRQKLAASCKRIAEDAKVGKGSFKIKFTINGHPFRSDANSEPGPSGMRYSRQGMPPPEEAMKNIKITLNGAPFTDDGNSDPGPNDREFRVNLARTLDLDTPCTVATATEEENKHIHGTCNTNAWASSSDTTGDSSFEFSIVEMWTPPFDPPVPVDDVTDVVDRWLYQNQSQTADDIYSPDYHIDDVMSSTVLPRVSHSAVDIHTLNRKRKLNQIDCALLETRSDTDLLIPGKRMRFH